MAFLSNAVSKVFPSIGKDANHNHSHNGRRGGLFRKISPNSISKKNNINGTINKKNQSTTDRCGSNKSLSSIFSVTRKQSLLQQQQKAKMLSKSKTFDDEEEDDCDCDCDCDYDYDDVTLECSPSPVPRKIAKKLTEAIVSIPNSPELIVPGRSSTNSNSNNTSSNFTDAFSSSGLLPRPAAIEECDNLIDIISFEHGGDADDVSDHPSLLSSQSPPPPLPPVSVIYVPKNFALPPSAPSKSLVVKKSYLNGPPPRVGEWDDRTIDSNEHEHEHEHDSTPTVEMMKPAPTTYSREQQDAETAAAVVSAMKPWIERRRRTARSALMMKQNNDINANHWGESHPRALLLKTQEQQPTESQPRRRPQQQERVVKWNIVRNS